MKTALILTVAGLLMVGYGIVSYIGNNTVTVTYHPPLAISPHNSTTEIVTPNYQVQTVSPMIESLSKKKVQNLVLNENDTVLLIGVIGENALSVAQEITRKSMSNKQVILVINSPGGSVLDGASIVSAIQASKVPVITVCTGLCASMASIIFEAGHKRLMVDRAILMFHDAAGGVQGTFPQIKDRFEFFSRYVNKMDNEIAHRAGLTLPHFMKKLNPECWRDAEDAFNEHFSDGYANLYFNGTQKNDDASMSVTKNLKNKFEVQLGN